MRKRRVPGETQPEELNMTPMIDVIFQLVIFFMCSSHFKQLEGKLQAFLPKDRNLNPTPIVDEPPPMFRVRLRKDGGAVTASLEQRTVASFPADPLRLVGVSKEWDRVGAEAGRIWSDLLKKDARAAVSIDAGDDVPFQYVVSALDACRRAGVTSIDFAGSGRVHESLRRR